MKKKVDEYSAWMKAYEDRIRRVAKIDSLDKAEAWIAEVSNDAGVRKMQREVRQIVNEARAFSRFWIKENLERSYNRGTTISRLAIEQAGLKLGKIPRTYLAASSINYGIEQMSGDMEIALGSITKKFNRMIRGMSVQIKGAKAAERMLTAESLERIATRSAVQSYVSGEGYKTTAQSIMDGFRKEIGAGLVRVVGPSGKPRNYQLKDYSQMVARTRMAEIHSEGTKNVLFENGMDFVEVTAYGTDCEICAEHEGLIYSISGEGELDNANFEGALTDDAEPPFHPNCTHVLMPYIPSEDEVESDPTGTFEALADEEVAQEGA
ncbi:MAG: phage minor capsid protein [Candidatus Paceibacterota bacterium]